MKINFRNYISFLLLILIIGSGCDKPEALTGTSTETAFISLTNVNASSKTVDVFVDGNKVNQFSAISTNANVSGTYVGTTPGTHTVEVRDNTTNAVYASSSITVEGAQTYSAFIYDTATAAGSLKLLLLKTDRTLPAIDKAHIGFLNLSPKSPALDVWLIRRLTATATGSLPVAQDSTMLYSNVPFVGNTTPDVNALSAFKPVAPAVSAGSPGFASTQNYIIRLKLAGTNTIVATSATLTFLPTKIYTIYVRGIYPSLTITTLLHN